MSYTIKGLDDSPKTKESELTVDDRKWVVNVIFLVLFIALIPSIVTLVFSGERIGMGQWIYVPGAVILAAYIGYTMTIIVQMLRRFMITGITPEKNMQSTAGEIFVLALTIYECIVLYQVGWFIFLWALLSAVMSFKTLVMRGTDKGSN